MSKWEKVAGEIEDEDLVKAPAFQDLVVDVIDPQDQTLPPELRGAQVIERQHVGSTAEVFYCLPSGATYSEAQANGLIETFRAAAQAVSSVAGSATPLATPSGSPNVVPGAAPGVVPGAAPGVVPGAAPGVVPGAAPGVVPGAAPGVVPGAAPGLASEMVIDVLGMGTDVPLKLRGARLVERPDGFFYLATDGTAIPKEVAEDLLDGWDSAEATGQVRLPGPEIPPESLIHTLGMGEDVPPKLRGARLVQAGEAVLYRTADGDALPPEVAEDLLEIWEPPKPQATPEEAPEESAVEILGSGEDVPPRLRGALLVEIGGVLFYRTMDGELLPGQVGDALRKDWEDDAEETVANAAALFSRGDSTRDATAQAAGDAQTLRRPFGLDDFGPLTIPEASVPETLDDRQESLAEGAYAPIQKPAPQPAPTAELMTTAEPSPAPTPEETPAPQAVSPAAVVSAPLSRETRAEPMRGETLTGQLRNALAVLRQQTLSGDLDLEGAGPSEERIETAIRALLEGSPSDERLARLLGRSLGVSQLLEEAWADDQSRERRELVRDLSSGTLVLVAVNPAQLKDIDVLELLTLVRAHRGSLDRLGATLARELRAAVLERLLLIFRSGALAEAALEAARLAPSLVGDGRLLSQAVVSLVSSTVETLVKEVVEDVLARHRALGVAVPGLAQVILNGFAHLATEAGNRVAQAIP